MSHKKYAIPRDVLMEDVWNAMNELEVDHQVKVNFSLTSKGRNSKRLGGRIILFARVLDAEGVAQTVSKNECTYPTSDGRTMASVLLMLVHAVYNQLDIGRKHIDPDYLEVLP
jgi:hypothetical protein